MADHISEEDSVLTRAIRDMTQNPWQARGDLDFPTPAQAYMAQRAEWMELLDKVEPWALPIFMENYPSRTDEGYGITTAGLPVNIANFVRAQSERHAQEAKEAQVTEVAAPEQITKREEILRTANRLIHGDRQQDYGQPIDSFTRVAQAMNVVLEGAGHPPIDATTAAKLMIALKLSRLAGGDNKDDTWIDLAGYAALGAEVRDQQ